MFGDGQFRWCPCGYSTGSLDFARDDSAVVAKAAPYRLEIARNQRLRGRLPALDVGAGEIHAANRSESRMAAERGAGEIEVWVENILAMLSSRQAIVDDEREHDITRGRLAVGDVFAPGTAERSVASHASVSMARIPPRVAEPSIRLIGAMVRGRPAHSGRERHRRQRLSASQKANRFVEGSRTFLCPDSGVSGQDHYVAAHPVA